MHLWLKICEDILSPASDGLLGQDVTLPLPYQPADTGNLCGHYHQAPLRKECGACAHRAGPCPSGGWEKRVSQLPKHLRTPWFRQLRKARPQQNRAGPGREEVLARPLPKAGAPLPEPCRLRLWGHKPGPSFLESHNKRRPSPGEPWPLRVCPRNSLTGTSRTRLPRPPQVPAEWLSTRSPKSSCL